MNIDEFIKISNTNIKELIHKNLTKNFYTFESKEIPKEKGVYFIFRKSNKELVYIGCAKERTLKKRLHDYVGKSTKASFRRKIIKNELNIAEENNKNIVEKATQYIKENFVLKFIIAHNDYTSSEIELIERACITLEKPKYNDKI